MAKAVIIEGEGGKHSGWNKKGLKIGAILFVLGILLALPLKTVIVYGLSPNIQQWVLSYFKSLPFNFGYWLKQYGLLVWHDLTVNGIPYSLYPFLLFIISYMAALLTNPYDKISTEWNGGRLARDIDLKTMGLLKGWIIVLGEWKKKAMMFKETLSALCVAPPGTGKTVGIVVPTILTCDKASMVINDVKPEIFDITSGFRSTKSFCIRLDWSASDQPEKGIFFPRWNPLSPLSMPPLGPERDLYIDRVVSVAIPDAKGNADPHWTFKGRAALAGFVHFLVSKTEAGNYTNIPKFWQGKEPCFPMLLDWITEALIKSGEDIEELRKRDPSMALFEDSVKRFMMTAVNEAREGDYSQRAIVELTQLANTPEKERGSILSTVDSGLTIFKNEAVRQRTSKSDFSFGDLRGMKDPKSGQYKPISVYITVNQEDVKSLSVITGLFVETLSAYLVAHRPEALDRKGNKLGPCPVLFVLDEFPQMPKLNALIDGPAVGRGQQVSYLMIGQDLGQIGSVYGEHALNTIFSTTSAKIVLPLNNEKTAERFSKMVAKKDKIATKSWSEDHVLGQNVNPFKQNKNYGWGDDVLLRPDELMNMPKGKHILLYQGYMHRPIYCDTPYYFNHPKYKKLVSKEFGGTYDVAPNMPDFMYQKRLEEYRQEQALATGGPLPPKPAAGGDNGARPDAGDDYIPRSNDGRTIDRRPNA